MTRARPAWGEWAGRRSRGRGLAAALAVTLALALFPPGAGAQGAGGGEPGAAPRLPDVPAGDGAFRGRVVHRTRPEASAEVEVFLYGLKNSGEAGLRSTRTDAKGRFAFEGVSAAPEIAYLLVARHDGVPYPGPRLRFEPDAPLTQQVDLTIADATRDASRVSRVESRVLVDPDAAAFLVREAHTLKVEGDEWVAAPTGGRLLHLPLPAGVEALRFDAASALGLAPDPAGGLALTGPLPPGETTVNLQFRLPAGDTLARRFGGAVPLVAVYVADSGDLLLESDRLHRRRPVRTDGRIYAHFEAFEVGADEEIRLSLGSAPPRATLSPRALLGVFGLLAAGVIGAVVAPLRGKHDEEDVLAPEESAARRERDAVYDALRDLEHDHETQKISDEDHVQLQSELRARAVALLREEKQRAAARTPGSVAEDAAGPAAAGDTPACPACRADVGPADRFCAACGAALESLAPTGESGARG